MNTDTAPLPRSATLPLHARGDIARMERLVRRFAQFALGAAFLSGIASRFGLWGAGVGYGSFENFVKYTAEVNAFMPAATIPTLAWAATAAELGLGIALVAGAWPVWTALGSAALLVLFGTAMTISGGPKPALDYSVFSAAACALLLAISAVRDAQDRAITSHQPEARAT